MDNRVALLRCSGYDSAEVEAVVRRAVSLLGGMDLYIQPGERVLVKPNMVAPSEPGRAVVTHPAVVRAVTRLVQEAGGDVIIADNPSAAPMVLRDWQGAYERSGWAAVAAETGAQLGIEVEARQCPHPDGHLIKVVDTSSFVTEADVVVSVPKLKSHGLVRYTGAVKNLFGTIPGATKYGYHVKMQSVDRFSDMLLDLVSFVRPVLTVMDAVVGMDGDGPSAGEPFAIGVVLAAPDPVALDVAAIELVGHEPASVPLVARAMHRGWTTGRLADLELLGDDFSRLQVEGFHMPPGGGLGMEAVPLFLRRWGARLLVPSPSVTKRCIGCRQCIDTCPAETIHQVGGKARIRLGNCIRCYCCHELCPIQAIELHQPALGRAISRLGR